jgi:hypothetical protein
MNTSTNQKGPSMTRAEHHPKTQSSRTGIFAVLSSALHIKGTHAPKTVKPRSLILTCLFSLVSIGLAATPALATPPEAPETLPAQSITATTATLEGILNPHSTARAGWYFAYSTEMTCALGAPTPVRIEQEVEDWREATTVTGLQPSTTYTFCMFATVEKVLGSEEVETTQSLNEPSFTTLAAPPAVEAEAASSVKATEATLEAQVNPNNQSTSYTIEYATSAAALGTVGAMKSTGGPLTGYGDNPVSFATGAVLKASETYFYRVIATNVSNEETKGEIKSFTTYTPPETPETTEPAKSISATTAVLEGVLNPGAKAKAGWYFAYNEGSSCAGGPTTPFEPEVQAQALPVKTEVTGLQPDKHYTFCLVAANGGGESAQGSEVSLPTPALAPTISGESATAVKATEATLHAEINPNNDNTKYFFEYASSEAALGTVGATKVEGAPPAAELENFGAQGVEASTGAALTAHTTYYYRVVAENAAHEKSEGKVEHFITGPLEAPDGLAGVAIATTTATLNGVLNPAHAVNPGSYEFLYKRSATECLGGETSSGSALGGLREAVKAEVAGLEPDTSYTFCLRAKDEAGEEVLSAPVTFRTLPDAYPTNATASSVTLHAVLDPEGASLSYRFEYATEVEYASSKSYGSQTPQASTSLADVEAHIQNLSPATLYHYRVLATNAAHETFASEDRTFTTQQATGAFVLPDARQYEMVTPPEKQGALFYSGVEASVIQASVNGDAFSAEASQPTEAGPKGTDEHVSVLSTRGSGGWSSQDIEGQHNKVGSLTVGGGQESRFFSEDLSHLVVQQFGGFTPLSPEASEPTPYLRTNYFNQNVSERCEGSYLTTGSCFLPLVTRANTRAGAVFGELQSGVCPRYFCGPHFVVGTPDLSHIVIKSRETLTPNAGTKYNTGTRYNFYEWSGGQLRFLPGELPTREGLGQGEIDPIGTSHAISTDGDRVILENNNNGLDLFDVADGETVRLDAPEPGCGACSSSNSSYHLLPAFQTANAEESRIFFLDNAPLTAEHSASGEDLYECEIVEVASKLTCDLSNLTPSVTANEVLGASEDGSYIYFAAGGGLAPGSVQGGCFPEGYGSPATEGCDVYVRHDGVTRLVAPSWIVSVNLDEPETSRVSPDGRWLSFMSDKSLTGYDNRDAAGGEPDYEVYLYHAETSPSGALEQGKLVCASCDPTGARPVGVKEAAYNGNRIKGWVAAEVPRREGYGEGRITVYQPRYLSDSGRLFFDSKGPLVPQDVNGVEDVYEYEPEGVPAGEHACSSSSTSGSEVFKPAHAFDAEDIRGEEGAGCVALVSSGTSTEPSSFLDASAGSGVGEHGEAGSEAGRDVFFLTTAKLAPQDFDDAPDVYDAHECTTESPCATSVVAPPACTTEASCKQPPTPQPGIYGLPSSATFSGPGNLAPPPPAVVVKPKPLTRAQKLANALKQCKKDKKKSKRLACEKTARKNYGPVKKAKKSSNNRRTK